MLAGFRLPRAAVASFLRSRNYVGLTAARSACSGTVAGARQAGDARDPTFLSEFSSWAGPAASCLGHGACRFCNRRTFLVLASKRSFFGPWPR